MRTFSANTVTVAGLVLVLVEFAVAGTELPALMSEEAYSIVAFVLGAVGVVCTFILRGQIEHVEHERETATRQLAQLAETIRASEPGADTAPDSESEPPRE